MNSKQRIVRSQWLYFKLINRHSLLITVFTLLTIYCLLATDVFALDVKRTVLPNGLIVLHSEKHSLPIVMVTLLVKASPLNEPKDKAGLSNLTAELLTEGTKHRNSLEISEEIDFIGASLDASANNDYTTLTLSVLKKHVEKGFDIFSDILLHPTFPQQEIDRKKERIKGFLIKLEEAPAFVAKRVFKKEVFGEHAYGRLTEGSLETIDNIKKQDMEKFYSEYFLPNNSILSIAGDLTPAELNWLIERYLSGWKKKDLPPKVERAIDKERLKRVIKIDRDLTQANIILGHLGISRDNPDYYAVSVMNYILGGGGFSSRLMQSIRDEMGLAYDVHSFFTANKEVGIFQVGVQTKNESANTVIDEILGQIDRIRKEKVSDEELSDAKSYLTGSFPRRLDTNRKIADFLAYVEFYNLGLDYIERYVGYINSVTKDDVLRVAGKYLNPENYVLVVVANQKKAALKY
ncbi:MAG: pitrilysin family protein [Thermodesulfovibrionales bacterium]|nr:pitrilysin family protein [Thermodesulfovibrionales bacterium]